MMNRATTWKRILIGAGAMALALSCIYCDPVSDSQTRWSENPADVQTPDGKALLSSLPVGKTLRAIGVAQVEIDRHRKKGIGDLLTALKDHLRARGVEPDVIDNAKITDETIGEPPSTLSGVMPDVAPQDFTKYFDCPILAPEHGTDSNTDCEQLVQAVVVKVKAGLVEEKPDIEQDVTQSYPDLGTDAKTFVAAWAHAAEIYGAEVAAAHAQHELMAASKCDTKANAMKISHNLGMIQGWELALQVADTYLDSTSDIVACVINTNTIAEAIKKDAKAKIDQYMKEHKVCEDADINAANKVLLEAEERRKEGIGVGIDQATRSLYKKIADWRAKSDCSGEMNTCDFEPAPPIKKTSKACYVEARAKDWQPTPDGDHHYQGAIYDVAGLQMCCRDKGEMRCIGTAVPEVKSFNKPIYAKLLGLCATISLQYIHVGSPLVVDLDDDGLELSRRPVTFDLLADGAPVRTAWAGPREALLAIDLDRDGRISSGAELFGNYADCGATSCADGVAALALWDSSDRGGNGDGLIDHRDSVFDRLRLWVDANQDGVSQRSELSTLDERGVKAFHLEATRTSERRRMALISARLQVLTDDGFRDAYDVWFKMRVAPRNLMRFMPPR